MNESNWKTQKIYEGFRWTDEKGTIILHRIAYPNAAFAPAVLTQNGYSIKILPEKWLELQQMQKLNGEKLSRKAIVSLGQEMIQKYFNYAGRDTDIIWLCSYAQAKLQISGAKKMGYNAKIIAGSAIRDGKVLTWTHPLTGEKYDNDQLVWVENKNKR